MNEMNESLTVLREKVLVAFIRKIFNLFETNKTDFPCLLYEELQCPLLQSMYKRDLLKKKDFDPGEIHLPHATLF